MLRFRAGGFTLIELLTVLALGSIIARMGVSGFENMMQRNQATVSVNWLIGSIAFARYNALLLNTMVTLCPSSNGTHCGGAWQDGTIAFTDHNADRKINGDDMLLERFVSPVQGGTIYWRSFRNRQYLQLTPTGMTNYQNGNIVYCSADRNPRFSRQIIISISGRPRVAHYTDSEGLPVDRQGKPIRC